MGHIFIIRKTLGGAPCIFTGRKTCEKAKGLIPVIPCALWPVVDNGPPGAYPGSFFPLLS